MSKYGKRPDKLCSLIHKLCESEIKTDTEPVLVAVLQWTADLPGSISMFNQTLSCLNDNKKYQQAFLAAMNRSRRRKLLDRSEIDLHPKKRIGRWRIARL